MSHLLHSVTANSPPCDGHNQDETSCNKITPSGHTQHILVIKYSYVDLSSNIMMFNDPIYFRVVRKKIDTSNKFLSLTPKFPPVHSTFCGISRQLTLSWCTLLASNVCLPLKYKINLMPQIHVIIIKNPKIYEFVKINTGSL